MFGSLICRSSCRLCNRCRIARCRGLLNWCGGFVLGLHDDTWEVPIVDFVGFGVKVAGNLNC